MRTLTASASVRDTADGYYKVRSDLSPSRFGAAGRERMQSHKFCWLRKVSQTSESRCTRHLGSGCRDREQEEAESANADLGQETLQPDGDLTGFALETLPTPIVDLTLELGVQHGMVATHQRLASTSQVDSTSGEQNLKSHPWLRRFLGPGERDIPSKTERRMSVGSGTQGEKCTWGSILLCWLELNIWRKLARTQLASMLPNGKLPTPL